MNYNTFMMDETEFAAAFSSTDKAVAIKKPKRWNKDATNEEIHHVFDWARDDISLMQLMRITQTNTTSVYSLIARAFRQAVKQGMF